jgi:hypothetical protein
MSTATLSFANATLPPSLAAHWHTLDTLSSSLAALRTTTHRHPHPHITPLASVVTPKIAPLTASIVAHHEQNSNSIRATNRLLALCPRVPLYHHDTLQSLLLVNDVTKRTDSLVTLLLSSSQSSSSITAAHWYQSFGSHAGTDDRSLAAILALVRYVSAALLEFDMSSTHAADDNNDDLYRLINRIIIYIINNGKIPIDA